MVASVSLNLEAKNDVHYYPYPCHNPLRGNFCLPLIATNLRKQFSTRNADVLCFVPREYSTWNPRGNQFFHVSRLIFQSSHRLRSEFHRNNLVGSRSPNTCYPYPSSSLVTRGNLRLRAFHSNLWNKEFRWGYCNEKRKWNLVLTSFATDVWCSIAFYSTHVIVSDTWCNSMKIFVFPWYLQHRVGVPPLWFLCFSLGRAIYLRMIKLHICL